MFLFVYEGKGLTKDNGESKHQFSDAKDPEKFLEASFLSVSTDGTIYNQCHRQKTVVRITGHFLSINGGIKLEGNWVMNHI